MEDLNTQLALLLGGSSVASSPLAAQSFDIDTLNFLNGSMSPEFSSPFFEQLTSPLLAGSAVDSMTIPMGSTDDVSLESLLTPGLSTNSLAPSPDLAFNASLSPAVGMMDLFPAADDRAGSPSLQLANALLGNGVAELMQAAQAEAAAQTQALAAITAQMLSKAVSQTPALPPPPAHSGADLQFAAMLLNMVREHKGREATPMSLATVPATATSALPSAAAAVSESVPAPALDPITGLPIKVKKKVGRKKKIRPTDPEIIAAELARKRSKNTEAARRSRQKRMQKVSTLEERLKMLEDERDEFEKRIAELEDIKATLEARVEELEADLSD